MDDSSDLVHVEIPYTACPPWGKSLTNGKIKMDDDVGQLLAVQRKYSNDKRPQQEYRTVVLRAEREIPGCVDSVPFSSCALHLVGCVQHAAIFIP